MSCKRFWHFQNIECVQVVHWCAQSNANAILAFLLFGKMTFCWTQMLKKTFYDFLFKWITSAKIENWKACEGLKTSFQISPTQWFYVTKQNAYKKTLKYLKKILAQTWNLQQWQRTFFDTLSTWRFQQLENLSSTPQTSILKLSTTQRTFFHTIFQTSMLKFSTIWRTFFHTFST